MGLPLFLLAAGISRRFGEADKRFAPLRRGCSMLTAMQRRGQRAGVAVNIILRDSDRDHPACAALPARRWYAARADEGMGSSLAEGLQQWLAAASEDEPPLPDAILVMPADLPLLRVSTIRAVARVAAADRIVRPRCKGRGGHPVAFGRQFWPELMALAGDIGAKTVIQSHASQLKELDVDDEGIYLDADTPQQLEVLAARLRDA